MTDIVITRALLEAGGIDAMVARSNPDLRLLTEAERAESLHQTLAARPPGQPVWLFGYGSLIWNPAIEFEERRVGTVHGWHRAFCLSTSVGRGTMDQPGLVLGLDAGGHCTGVAFRLAEDGLEDELRLLWRREMLAGSYVPRWLILEDTAGVPFGHALAFTINKEADQYAGTLTKEAIIRTLATAGGELGSCASYLFRTSDGLREMGIVDAELEQMVEAVRAAQAVTSSDTGTG
jgi:cation transport protein ChaC